VQTADDSNSRTYLDFAAPAQAWDAITRMYEERLKVITPGVKSLSYDVHDLFRWLDNLADISCLVCVTIFLSQLYSSEIFQFLSQRTSLSLPLI
jgi:hypothetical protein